MNKFLTAMATKNTTTWNGAISHSTSGVSVLDYFAKCGSYRGRTEAEVSADMASIFGENPEDALKVVFYNRLITRKPVGLGKDCDTVQRGQGQKDEFVKSLAWLENNYPDFLYKNLWAVPMVGCWKDLWYDSPCGFYYYVKREKVYRLVARAMKDETHRGLLAKYLPKIRSTRNVTNDRHRRLNDWARGLCKYLGWTERDYRKFKSDSQNTAHLWQRQACSNEWDDIDFQLIPGKALMKLVAKDCLQKHGLEKKYLEWIKKQPVAKFNGYPYELYQKAKTAGRNLVQRYTYDAQFEQLLKTARTDVNPELLRRGVLCALDTSGSMTASYAMNGFEGKLAPIDICVGLGIYFSSLIEGHFKNHVIMFDDTSRFLKLNGTFCEKASQIPANAMGGTNFQSVIDEIVRVRRTNPSIPVEEYPQVLLVVSDMQFNPVATRYNYRSGRYTYEETNYEALMRKLAEVGLPPMTVIWWQVNGRFTGDVPVKWDTEGTVLISGFDGAIVTSILGGMEKVVDKETGQLRKKNPLEVMQDALNQEILNRLEI